MNNVSALAAAVRRKAETELFEVILPFWTGRAVDWRRGGWFGRIDGNDRPDPEAPRGAILNARILWSFSAAARITGDATLRAFADRAWEYFRSCFIDHEFGGVYWNVNCDGSVRGDFKHVYSNGFALYGLSEYYRLTGNPAALQEAEKIFHCLEEKAFRPGNGSYAESFRRDWAEEVPLPHPQPPSSMNTALHILEPYTNFHRAAPSGETAQALRKLLRMFLDRIYDPADGHFRTFFDLEWHSLRREYSYGHEIEGAWLLTEAAEILNDPAILKEVSAVLPQLTAAALEGLRPDGSMIYEFQPDRGKLLEHRSWWVQAELVVGCVNAWEHGLGEEYLRKADAALDYIATHFSDRRNGEWFQRLNPDGSAVSTDDKAGHWKCPYHNSRMCLEVITRLAAHI